MMQDQRLSAKHCRLSLYNKELKLIMPNGVEIIDSEGRENTNTIQTKKVKT